METTIANAKAGDKDAADKVSAAFGKDWETHHDKLNETLGKMKSATMTVNDANPKTFDDAMADKRQKDLDKWQAAGQSIAGLPTADDVRNNGANAQWSANTKKTSLGSMWHNKAPPLHQAGTLIHELSHQVSRTGDHVVKADSTIVNSSEAKKVTGEVIMGGGCTLSTSQSPWVYAELLLYRY
jgi:hypothetical protein